MTITLQRPTPFIHSAKGSWEKYGISYCWVYGEDHRFSHAHYKVEQKGKEPVDIQTTETMLELLCKPGEEDRKGDLHIFLSELQNALYSQMFDDEEESYARKHRNI